MTGSGPSLRRCDMDLVPTQEDVVNLLRQTGALRDGHFEYPNGLHCNEYLQVALAMRYYQHAKVLSVGLSRLLRANSEIRAIIPELSIVAPATGGLPVAYGVGEALQAEQIYWAERQEDGRLRFRQFMEDHHAERVILVDDILRSGRMLKDMVALLETQGARILALGVIVYQPNEDLVSFGSLPIYSLAKLQLNYYSDAASCGLCRQGLALQTTWV